MTDQPPIRVHDLVHYHPQINGPDDGLVYTVTEIIECVLGGVHSQSAILKCDDRRVSCDVAHLTPAPAPDGGSGEQMLYVIQDIRIACRACYPTRTDLLPAIEAIEDKLRAHEQLERDCARLRGVLAVYADRKNWDRALAAPLETVAQFFDVFLLSDGEPFKRAADALAAESEGR